MATNQYDLDRVAHSIVEEALRIAHVRWDDKWEHKHLGESAGVNMVAFRQLLPKGAYWDLAKPFRCWKENGTYKTQGVSTCGLIALGIIGRVLESMGISMPWMTEKYWDWTDPLGANDKAYNDLDVVSCLTMLGLATQSRRPKGVYPQSGDMVCIGSGTATHVFTVVSTDGHYVWSVDGGAVDTEHGNLQCVRLTKRDWRGLRVNWIINTTELVRKLSK
jgi:hypothetical protein